MGYFWRALCALPLAAALFATPATAATVIANGTIEHQWEDYPPTVQDLIYISESGTYTFKSDGDVVRYSEISIDLQYMYHGHTDDDKYGWGHNNIGVPFSWADLPEPTYVFMPGVYSVSVQLPRDTYAHFDGCWYDSCGYWEAEHYTPRAYVSLDFTEGSAGKAWTFEFEPFATAVPEPSTWALMILGFGLAGAQMRSVRRRVITA